MKKHLLPVFFALLLFAACDSKTSISTTIPVFKKTRTITGELFIVLQSRETLKLSLVDICVVDKSLANAVATNRAAIATNVAALEFKLASLQKSNEVIRAQIEESRTIIDQCSQRVASKAEATNQKLNRIARLPDWMQKIELDADSGSYQSTLKMMNLDKELAQRVAQKIEKLTLDEKTFSAEMEKAKADLRNVKSNENLLRNVTATCVQKTTTDSDGKFTLRVEGSEPLYLLAQATRKLGIESEDYAWLVPVPENSEEKMLLSNNNLIFP